MTDADIGAPDQPPKHTGHWRSKIALTRYLLKSLSRSA